MSKTIIGFAGRLQSGKTELAKICEEFGYKRLSVALPLKEMIAALLHESIEGVNMLKTANLEVVFDKEDQEYIAYRTRIPIDIIKDKIENKVFKNTREMMQFIGTDLIRAYNPNWHVDELKKLMEKDGLYVIDDIRFQNEAQAIYELGGECWYVVRPKIDNVLNHESEISLHWQDFDNIIINDSTLEYLTWNWKNFMENGYSESLNRRKELMYELQCNKNKIVELITSSTPFSMTDAYFISKWEFTYNATFRNVNTIKNVEQTDKFVTVTYNEGNVQELVRNPLMIEDLKMYV